MEKATISSSQPHLQPQPPSSHKHSESRQSLAKDGTVSQCSLNKASTKSVNKTEGGSDTTTKTVIVRKGEQKPHEPSTTCTVVQPPKNKRTVNDEETPLGGKGDHTHLISDKGPEVQQKNEDMILGSGQKQIPAVTLDVASHKPEVRNGFLLKSLQHYNSLDFIQTFGNCLRYAFNRAVSFIAPLLMGVYTPGGNARRHHRTGLITVWPRRSLWGWVSKLTLWWSGWLAKLTY